MRGKASFARRRLLFVAVLLLTLVAPRAAHPDVAAAARSQFFTQTGHNVADPFLRFYEQHGGLMIFGLPLTEAFNEGTLTIQYFERARLEWHTDYSVGRQIAIGQIGRELSATRIEDAPFRRLAGPTGGMYFPETGHSVRGGFADYWRANGDVTVFGYPLSEEFTEMLPDVGPVTVQYFERARLELLTPTRVGLGLLGALSFRQRAYPRALLAPVSALAAPEPRPLTIPVLEYHDVGFGVGTYQVTLPAFRAQLDWLQANGYTTVTLDDVYAAIFEGGDLPPKPVVITFDDGRASQWNAVQELNARGMKGVFFILGNGNALGDGQIRQLIAQGHEIESHTMSHPQLSRLSDAQLAYELVRSKQTLEAKYGVPIRYLAYPYGDYDGRVINAAIAAGYDGALAAWGGGSWTPQKRWQEPRIIITGFATIGEFAGLVRGATSR
ncbi:MAG TPA: polysaccharide deacetylase family protein [Thermomicrobiales bacterium]|jgi:peptidoglycan/xylan/chitin deacetylase (PgdA/CDA1 family)